jgi:hypothetical protein
MPPSRPLRIPVVNRVVKLAPLPIPEAGKVESPLLDRGEAAAFLRMSSSWVRAETLAGRIPCVRLGRRCLYDKRALENLIAQATTKGAIANG